MAAILNLRQFVGAGQVGQDVDITSSLTSHLSRPVWLQQGARQPGMMALDRA